MKTRLLFNTHMLLAIGALIFLSGQGSMAVAQVSPKDREYASGSGGGREKDLRDNARRLNNPPRKRQRTALTSNTTSPSTTTSNTIAPDTAVTKTDTPGTETTKTDAPGTPQPTIKASSIGEQVDDAIELGNEQRKAQRYSAAEQAYRLAVRLDPKDARAYVGLGNIYFDLNKYTEAVDFYSEAIRLNPNDAAAYFGRGYSYYQMNGKEELAIEDGKQAVRLDTEEDYALWGIVYLYKQKNRLEEAVLFYKEQVRRRPDYAKAYIALGWAYQLWQQPEETVKYYEQAIRIKPDYLDAYKWLAEVYSGMGKQAEARAAYHRQAQAYSPLIAKATDKDHLYSLYETQGGIYMRAGDYKSALQAYRQMEAIRPDSCAYSSIVSAYTRMEDYPGAVETYKQWIKLGADNARLYSEMGDLYKKLNQPALAEDAYNQAINLYKQEISTKPTDMAYAFLGRMYLHRLNQVAKAIDIFKQAIRLYPDSGTIHNYLGEAYLLSKKYAEAVKSYKEAMRLSVLSSNDYGNLAAAYYELKQYAQAVEAALKVINCISDHAQARFYLGESYIALDNNNGAAEQLSFFNAASDDYKKRYERWITQFRNDFYRKWPVRSTPPRS